MASQASKVTDSTASPTHEPPSSAVEQSGGAALGAAINLPESPASPNPWNDAKAPENQGGEALKPEEKPVSVPDSATFSQSIFTGLKSDSPMSPTPRSAVPKEILNEFDPLVSPEEQAAKQAWESSESHPPPPRTPSPPPPSPPEKDQPNASLASPTGPTRNANTIASPSGSSSFPSLAALARTFSIPLARPRPQSIDVARAVPSPATLSSFASQQDSSRPDGGGSGSASRSGSGTGSPAPSTRPQGEAAFDFQSFLDQMKSKSAEPVSKYLRSFLSNFAKRTFTVNDQVKIINDFLVFISGQMRACDVWKNVPDAEFDNAMEGMEKLVMNRLYEFTFTPQLERAVPPRPITTDDLERDKVLSQRIALFGWIEEKHLDIPEEEGSKGFLMFAQQELLKLNHYKAPRDKLICILNCCKVIFGLIRHLKTEEGADAFVPLLIFVVLKANPEHLLSNVEFINRFRNPEKLQSEAGYYLSSLMGAVSFIETMDHTSLSHIDQAEFETNVEEAIRALPQSEPQSPVTPFAESKIRPHIQSPHAGEESAQLLSLSTPSQTLSDDAKRLLQKTGDTISKPLNAIGRIFSEALDGAENKLAYLPGPFAPFELGRESRQGPGSAPATMASPWAQQQQQQQQPPYPVTPQSAQLPYTPGVGGGTGEGAYAPPLQTPYKPRMKRPYSPSAYSYTGSSPGGSPGYGPEETPSRSGPYTNQALAIGPSQTLVPPRVNYLANEGAHISRTPTPTLDLGAVQAQIDAAHQQEARLAREQLAQIFPGTDSEIVDWVLEANDGDLGRSIEALLEMNSGT